MNKTANTYHKQCQEFWHPNKHRVYLC